MQDLNIKQAFEKKINDQTLMDLIFSNSILALNTYFFEKNVLDAKVLRTKLLSLAQDLALTKSSESKELESINDAIRNLQGCFDHIDCYQMFISEIISHMESKNSSFYKAFFHKDLDETKKIFLQIYPQTMPLGHYKEIFSICGYPPALNIKKVFLLTKERYQYLQSFKKEDSDYELFDEYHLSELFEFVKDSKIKSMVEDFWLSGILKSLEDTASNKGGRLISNEEKLKVFEVDSQTVDENGNALHFLVYATPAFYSYKAEDIYNKAKGEFYFLKKNPKSSTVIIESDFLLTRRDLIKVPSNLADDSFRVKVKIPVNLYRFCVNRIES